MTLEEDAREDIGDIWKPFERKVQRSWAICCWMVDRSASNFAAGNFDYKDLLLAAQVFLRCELSSLKILPAVQYHIYFSFTLIYFPFPPCCTKIYFEPLKSLCATLLTRSTLSLCFQTTTTTNSTKIPQFELQIWHQCTRIICSSYFECLRKLYKWLWCMFRTRQQ